MKNVFKRNKGITLIALVVTIIVLLILAGVSITMLTGQNGILNRAREAKEKTDVAQADENEKLQGYEDTINQFVDQASSGGGDNQGGDSTGGNALPTGEGTTPYLPNNTFTKKEGDLATGLVIKDSSDNEYVWVEVPTTIYDNTEYNSNGAKKPSDSEDYTNIEACLKAYTADYKNSSYSDTNSSFTTLYQNMLKSVYTNGGFWIGRYEAGLEEGKDARTLYTAITDTDKAVVKPNMIPYNYVTRDEAQTLAGRMNYEGVTSSLIFGVQWDLVLKYIESKNATTKANLTTDSTTIGNYCNSEFTINKGKFAQYNSLSKWYDFNSEEKPSLVTGRKKISQSSYENGILLTTGAAEVTSLQKIYDIAGNVYEWTLEFYSASYPCVDRGGSYDDNGSNFPVKSRGGGSASYSNNYIGFRLGLWK